MRERERERENRDEGPAGLNGGEGKGRQERGEKLALCSLHLCAESLRWILAEPAMLKARASGRATTRVDVFIIPLCLSSGACARPRSVPPQFRCRRINYRTIPPARAVFDAERRTRTVKLLDFSLPGN